MQEGTATDGTNFASAEKATQGQIGEETAKQMGIEICFTVQALASTSAGKH